MALKSDPLDLCSSRVPLPPNPQIEQICSWCNLFNTKIDSVNSLSSSANVNDTYAMITLDEEVVISNFKKLFRYHI